MKFVVWKNYLGAKILYRSVDPAKNGFNVPLFVKLLIFFKSTVKFWNLPITKLSLLIILTNQLRSLVAQIDINFQARFKKNFNNLPKMFARFLHAWASNYCKSCKKSPKFITILTANFRPNYFLTIRKTKKIKFWIFRALAISKIILKFWNFLINFEFLHHAPTLM